MGFMQIGGGDTYMAVRVPKAHCERFLAQIKERGLVPDTEEVNPSFTLFEFDSVVAGGVSVLEPIAKGGVIFSGCHGEYDGECGPHEFVGDGTSFLSWETGWGAGYVLHPEFKNNNPLLLVIPDKKDLHSFLKAAERVEKYLLGSEDLPRDAD